MSDPITHFFGGGVYAKQALIPAGAVVVQHKHTYDHLAYLVAGTVEVQVDGEKRVVTGPAGMTIEANKHHGVKALTDAIWLCIHATDCVDADHVDEVLIAPSGEDMNAIARSML